LLLLRKEDGWKKKQLSNKNCASFEDEGEEDFPMVFLVVKKVTSVKMMNDVVSLMMKKTFLCRRLLVGSSFGRLMVIILMMR